MSFYQKETLTETMEDNRSLQTQFRIVNSDEERMKLNLQKYMCIEIYGILRRKWYACKNFWKGNEQFSESCIGKSTFQKET